MHTATVVEALGIDPAKAPTTFPYPANVGPASLPITFAAQADELSAGDRVLLMGIGSGLNTSCVEVAW